MVKKSGPQVQPAAIAKLKGTYREDRYKDQLAEDGLVFLSRVPEPPEILNEDGKYFWNSILTQGVAISGYIAVQDIFIFEELCFTYQQMSAAKKDIKKSGNTNVDENGNRHKSIAYIIYKEALKDFGVLCREFGLSPSSRTGMKIATRGENKEADKYADLKL